MSATVTMQDYPRLAQVLEAEIEGSKRKRVLGAIASFHDERRTPTLQEITDRAGLADWQQARSLITRLEADGLLEVRWAPYRKGRNRYRVTLGLA